MKPSDLLEMFALAALWGGSFLFMRLGAGEFGPVALSAVRVVGAALVLLPLLTMQHAWGDLRRHWRTLFAVGFLNSVIPFLCYSYAIASITGGLASIFNAATPLFGAAIAWWWLKDRLNASRVTGLAIGFVGVAWLAADRAIKPGGTGLAVLACMGATLFYGIGANYTKRYLTGVAPIAVAAGSQIFAAVVLVPMALPLWPAQMPSARAWTAALLLATVSTGLAYALYFRLIANIGAARATTVTFLIPLFAVLWGWLLLDEGVTVAMLVGSAIILVGTSLATGLVKLPKSTVQRPPSNSA